MKKHILILSIILLKLSLTFQPVFAEIKMTAEFDSVVAQAIYQIKNVLINQSTPEEIRNLINQVRKAGGTGYKVNNYDGGKMGWSIQDSKQRVVHSIVFTFNKNKASEGVYYGPLMASQQAAREVHDLHVAVLFKHYKQVGSDKYDFGDNCEGFIVLLKGQTQILITCNKN